MEPEPPPIYAGQLDAHIYAIITIWPDHADLSLRRNHTDTWSPPIHLNRIENP